MDRRGLANAPAAATPFDVQDWTTYFGYFGLAATADLSPQDFLRPMEAAFKAFQTIGDGIQLSPSKQLWKHPEQTVSGGTGNAWDQALAQLQSLLIGEAAANPVVDTRLEVGRVTFSGNSFDWLGVDNIDAAKSILDVAGLNPVVVNGSIEFDHAWLMAHLPRPTGLDWRTLDPSIVQGEMLRESPPVYLPGGIGSDPYFSRIDPSQKFDSR